MNIFGLGKPKSICAECGSTGKTRLHTPGNLALEIVLWFFLILPGLFYTIWRCNSRVEVCKVCGSQSIFPLKTPRGRELATKWQPFQSAGGKP